MIFYAFIPKLHFWSQLVNIIPVHTVIFPLNQLLLICSFKTKSGGCRNIYIFLKRTQDSGLLVSSNDPEPIHSLISISNLLYVVLQDPTNLDKFNVSDFFHVKNNLKVLDPGECCWGSVMQLTTVYFIGYVCSLISCWLVIFKVLTCQCVVLSLDLDTHPQNFHRSFFSLSKFSDSFCMCDFPIPMFVYSKNKNWLHTNNNPLHFCGKWKMAATKCLRFLLRL